MSRGTSSAIDRRWAARIARAHELQEEYRAAKAVLHFYSLVLEFQADLASTSQAKLKPELPLRDQLEFALAVRALPKVLDLAAKNAPGLLASRAEALQKSEPTEHLQLLRSAALSASDTHYDTPESFVARACLQPLAENLQVQLPEIANHSQSVCPACDGLAQAAVLRPEGDGRRRSLLCSFCLREWVFRRVVCPWCGEENKEKLPQYSAEECAHVRIEACDVCKRYIKATDLSVDGHAVPLVDEAATAVLDVWAGEHGYSKIALNLMGF